MEYFIHVGFSKCASSWLQSFFRSSNSIYYIEKSHYFNPLYQVSVFSDLNDKDYFDYFKNAKDNQILLESDEHLMLPDYCQALNTHGTRLETVFSVVSKIKEKLTSPKIILVIRNHKELIISRYSQFVVSGGKLSFNEFFDILTGRHTGKDYFQNYYFQIINKLVATFGKENVQILLQEELNKDKEKGKTALSEFIGIQLDDIKSNIFTKRKGLSIFGIKILRFFNLVLVKEKESIYSPIKTFIPKWFYLNLIIRGIRLMDYYLLRSSKRNKYIITMEHETYLKNKFKNDNIQLAKLLDKPLNEFGYYV